MTSWIWSDELGKKRLDRKADWRIRELEEPVCAPIGDHISEWPSSTSWGVDEVKVSGAGYRCGFLSLTPSSPPIATCSSSSSLSSGQNAEYVLLCKSSLSFFITAGITLEGGGGEWLRVRGSRGDIGVLKRGVAQGLVEELAEGVTQVLAPGLTLGLAMESDILTEYDLLYRRLGKVFFLLLFLLLLSKEFDLFQE